MKNRRFAMALLLAAMFAALTVLNLGVADTERETIRFGVLPINQPQTMAKRFNPLMAYLENVLLNPSKGQLMAEARGRVMIYDGLDNEVVEQALDEQFERIEHMLFMRIQHAQPGGEVVIEDDGC